MKPQFHFFFRLIIYLLVVTTITISCEKDKEKPSYNYLENYQLINSYTPEQIQSIIIIGSIVYPEIDTLLSTSAFGVDVYKINYKTTFKGEYIIASGIVSMPKVGEAFPILSFQNGTNTCHSNAPSENSSDQLFRLISITAGNGYIVAIPDYFGFGASEQILHPYHHRESNNRAVIDFILAIQELLDIKDISASANGELFLMGYSQGGWATLSVLDELEKSPVEGLTPAAVSIGAGAYDMYQMGNYIVNIDEYPNPFYLPYFIQSHISNGFMEGSLATYFNEPFATNIPGFFVGALCNPEMNEQFPTAMNDLLTAELVSDYESGNDFESLRQELTENSVPPWNVKTPLMIYHSMGDKSVPYFESVNLYNSLLNKGVASENIKYILVDDLELDHSDAVVPWGVEALTWFGSIK